MATFPQRLDSPLAYDIAKAMMDGFNRHYRLFRTESARAKHRFETADWHGQQRAQRERIEFYDLRVKEASARLEKEFHAGELASHTNSNSAARSSLRGRLPTCVVRMVMGGPFFQAASRPVWVADARELEAYILAGNEDLKDCRPMGRPFDKGCMKLPWNCRRSGRQLSIQAVVVRRSIGAFKFSTSLSHNQGTL